MKLAPLAGVLLLVAGAPPLCAQASDKAPPQVFKQVIDCRSIGDTAARLACYDTAVAALAEAQQSKELVVVSREEVRQARRGLFGFTLPKIRLFGDDDDDDAKMAASARIDSIDAKVGTVGGDSGSWLITIDTGARWQQIDGEYINRPQPGQPISIRRGMVGGYTAKVGTGRAFRVRRLAE